MNKHIEEYIDLGIIKPINSYVLCKDNLDIFKNDLKNYLGEFNNISYGSLYKTYKTMVLSCKDYRDYRMNIFKNNGYGETHPKDLYCNGKLLVITDIFEQDFIYEINEESPITLYEDFIKINSLKIFKATPDESNCNLFLQESIQEYLNHNLLSQDNSNLEGYIASDIYDIIKDMIYQIELDKQSFKSNVYSQVIETKINEEIHLFELQADFNNMPKDKLIIKYCNFINDEEIDNIYDYIKDILTKAYLD